jgi:hypothetical protein
MPANSPTGSGYRTSTGSRPTYRTNRGAGWGFKLLSDITGALTPKPPEYFNTCTNAQVNHREFPEELHISSAGLKAKLWLSDAEKSLMPYKLAFLILIGLSLLTAKGANPQNLPALKTGATLTGVVLGIDGRPVAKASVSCQTAGGLAPHAVYTDAKGRFTVKGLKQDSYDLRAYFNGTYSDWIRNLPLRSGQTKAVTLRLLNHVTPASNTTASQKNP